MTQHGGAIETGGEAAAVTRSPERETASPLRQRPALVALAVILAIVVALLVAEGAHDFGQATVNGLVSGSYFALGAVGLTLVYGILRLVNFAHGDFLTFGAYIAYLVNVTWGMPLAVGVVFAMLTTAIMAIAFETILWRPMRAR